MSYNEIFNGHATQCTILPAQSNEFDADKLLVCTALQAHT